MRPPTISACLILIAAGGCAPLKPTSPEAPPNHAPVETTLPARPAIDTAASPAGLPDASVAVPPEAASPSVMQQAPVLPTQNSTAAAGSATGTVIPPQRQAAERSGGKNKSLTPSPPVKQAAPPAEHPPLAKPPIVASPPEKRPESGVPDLAALEQRLRDTHAIGVFTKLSLKNQVDDLLDRLRTLYRGPTKAPTAELRERYDLLLLKVVTLLQDNDPPLATAISSSREALWAILSDPEKFANIQL